MTDFTPDAASESPLSHIDVVGLGPAGADLITAETLRLMEGAGTVYLRTTRHPAAAEFLGTPSFDHHYETGSTFDDVYRAIVADLLVEAHRQGKVVYAVPGSPMVAERTVGMLLEDQKVLSGEVSVVVHPALSFLDVAFARLQVDPVTSGVRIVDASSFASSAAGERGPLLVAQCWSRAVLSEIKLCVEPPPGTLITVLHHLGLDDEWIGEVDWYELDRSFEPDHLTSLWIPNLAVPVAGELVRLGELTRTLRERCPWDQQQTHGSLARHLMEESYEVLEAIDEVARVDERRTADHHGGEEGKQDYSSSSEAEERAVAHLEEELGDLLFQVYFHATLAAEAGRFTLADVARGVHDKLVSRHPHVFGDITATTPEQVASNWEMLKKAEKNRTSVTEGIPAALPALALAAKLQRKAVAVGMTLPGLNDELSHLTTGVTALAGSANDERIGSLLFSLVNVARLLGVDAESALRARLTAFRTSVESLG